MQNSLKPAGMIGIGIMGSAMAANLVKAGFTVYGTDPVAAARRRHQRNGGIVCTNATEVAQHARLVVLSLPSVDALDQV